MRFSSNLRRFLLESSRRNVAREARRRQTQREFRRRRLFEELESRALLDANGFESLPDTITLAAGDSYHYALEGADLHVATSDGATALTGLTASVPTGSQVAFTVTKTSSTDGSVSTLGEIVLQLFEAEGEAPNSSNRFTYLVDSGYYEGLSIHRIIEGFMFQGGSSDGAGISGEGTTIADEHSDLLQHNKRGMVAFANKGANTSDAQFYVMFDAASWLDGKYNVFGFVVDGYDVVDQLEKATVTTNSSEEKSLPVDSYKLSNVRILDAAEVNDGVLRVSAAAGTSGATKITVSGTDVDGTTKTKEIAVSIVDSDSLLAQIPKEIEMTAGETKLVELPAELNGETVSYKVYSSVALKNMSLEFQNSSNSSYKITTTEAGAQYVSLTIVATIGDDGVTATTTQSVFVAPIAPSFTIEGAGKLDDGTLVVGANGVDDVIVLAISTKSDESSPVVKIDDVSYQYTTLNKTIDSAGLSVKRIQLTVNSYAALADGSHKIEVSQYLPVNNVSSHEALYSAAVEASLLIDAAALEFVDFPSTLAVSANEAATIALKTNKTNADGSARSDVQYQLSDDAPSFVSLDDDGTLHWNPTADAVGTYSFDVSASDAAGHTATQTLALTVASGPRYEISGKTTIDEGGTFAVKIEAEEDADVFEAPFEFTVVEAPKDLDAKSYSIATSDDGKSATFSWTTAEKDGPGEYKFVVKIVDADSPDVPSYATLTLTVSEVNTAPKIEYAGETTIETNDATPISIQLTPIDTDLPAQELTWFFSDEAPEWLLIDSETGLLSAANPVAGTYVVDIYLSDGSLTSEPLTLTLKVGETDRPPVFKELTETTAKTGETYSATVSASDPNSAKKPIKYALVGDEYPEGFELDAKTGAVSWAIPEDYLETSVSAKTFSFVVKATEQILGEDGETYSDGLSTEKTFEITIANAKFDESNAKAPVWSEIAAQTTTAGKKFELTATATAPEEAVGVQYELTGDVPSGMTIDAATGAISWDVPADYFTDNSVESESLTISIKATAILSSDEDGDEFGGDATTTFELTVSNPNYEKPEADTVYETWQEWFDAWVANEQARKDGLASNLQTYLNDYTNAADARDAQLKSAVSDYHSGTLSISEFIVKKAEIQSTFDQATTTARAELANNDAKTEADYNAAAVKLNEAYETLNAKEDFDEPGSIKADAENAAENVSQTNSTSDSNFTLRNDANGATISLDLATVLKLWRSGYSGTNSIYSDVFSDKDFAENAGEETASDETTKDESDSGTETGTGTKTGDEEDEAIENA